MEANLLGLLFLAFLLAMDGTRGAREQRPAAFAGSWYSGDGKC